MTTKKKKIGLANVWDNQTWIDEALAFILDVLALEAV